MAQLATISPYIYCSTFCFVLSGVSLTGGFFFLVMASLSGYSSDGAFDYIPLSDGIVDITMFVNMVLFLLNLYIVQRLVRDEGSQGKLSFEEEALFRFFQARSGMNPLQFKEVLKNGEFVDLPADTAVPKCGTTLYLVLEGLVSCRGKFDGDKVGHAFTKRSGEFFDVKLFNLFSMPIGFDNIEFNARTMTPVKCFAWNYTGIIAMRDAKSPSLNEYWQYIVLMSLKSSAVMHHLKKNDTLYDSLMIPEHKSWLEGAPSRDFWKQPAEYGNWNHWKQQFEVIKKAFGLIPPRGVRQHPCIPDGMNPKQAYIELLCRTAEMEERMADPQTASFIMSKRESAKAKSHAIRESDGPPTDFFSPKESSEVDIIVEA
ncbi:MAG: hypothetical protein SGARI_004057 [Bacillariaceae sp.]